MNLLRNPIVVGTLAVVAGLLVFKNALWPLFSHHSPPAAPAVSTSATPTAGVVAGAAEVPAAGVLTAGAGELSPTNRPANAGTNIDWYRIATSAGRWTDSARRDPFRVQAEGGRLAGETGAMAKLTLNAVWRQTDSTLAVVNNQTLGEGDTILGYRIESIESDRIWVLGPNGREEVRFKPSPSPDYSADKPDSHAP